MHIFKDVTLVIKLHEMHMITKKTFAIKKMSTVLLSAHKSIQLRESEMNGESSLYIYIYYRVKWITGKKLLCNTGRTVCDDLEGWDGKGKGG